MPTHNSTYNTSKCFKKIEDFQVRCVTVKTLTGRGKKRYTTIGYKPGNIPRIYYTCFTDNTTRFQFTEHRSTQQLSARAVFDWPLCSSVTAHCPYFKSKKTLVGIKK